MWWLELGSNTGIEERLVGFRPEMHLRWSLMDLGMEGRLQGRRAGHLGAQSRAARSPTGRAAVGAGS